MMEELLVGSAEVIEPGFPIWRGHETMLWAFAITRKANIALAAEGGK